MKMIIKEEEVKEWNLIWLIIIINKVSFRSNKINMIKMLSLNKVKYTKLNQNF